MAGEPQEDVPYEVDSFAIEDQPDIPDDPPELSPEGALVKELRSYLKQAEADHNSLDLIDLTEQAKMTPTQQIAVHKLVVTHIRAMAEIINSRVKEK